VFRPSNISDLSTLDVADRFKNVALHEGKQVPIAIVAPLTGAGREDGALLSPAGRPSLRVWMAHMGGLTPYLQ
jgi:hypothetical protein